MSPVLLLLLRVHGALAASYLLFRAVGARGFVLPAYRLRAARALFGLSFLLPLGLTALPARSLPEWRIPTTVTELDGADHPMRRTRVPAPRLRAIGPAPALPSPGASSRSIPGACLWALLAIAATLAAARLRRSVRALRALVRGALPLRQLGRVRILVSEEIAVPFSARLDRRAYVLLPARLLGRSRDLSLALRHELQHHRAGDTIAAWRLELLRCAFGLNPAFQAWAGLLVGLQEEACDHAVIHRGRGVSPRTYAECLLRAAEDALRARQPSALALAMISSQPPSALRRRIEMLAQTSGPHRSFLALFTLAVGGLFTFAVGAQALSNPAITAAPNPGRAHFVAGLQSRTEKILARSVAEFQAAAGFAVVGEASTGRILAVAGVRRDGRDADRAWPLSFRIEPASAMKGIIAAAALEKGLTQPDEKLDCGHGLLTLGARTYKDWKDFDHLTTAGTVAQSSNVCGIRLGQKLGVEGLERALRDFGFGPDGSAQDFPEARPGVAPRSDELPAEIYIPLISTGYTATPGFYVTPLEIVQAYAVIANGGLLMKPRLADDPTPVTVRRVLSSQTAGQMKAILVEAVRIGTGAPARSARYTTAGKTSSAFSPENSDDRLGGERGMAGFVGFAPAHDPRLVVYVGMLDPRSGSDHRPHGAAHAAPVFRKLVDELLPELGVRPDQD